MNCERFQDCKDEIKLEYEVNKDYYKAIMLLHRLEMLLENETKTGLSYPYQLWYVYYDLGFCYKKINKYEVSKQYLKKSLICLLDNKEPNHCKSRWLYANNCLELGEHKVAKQLYIRLSKDYKYIEMKPNRLFALMNISKVNKNIMQLLRLVKIFIHIDPEELERNSNVYIDQIVPSIIDDAREIKGENELAFKRIVNLLKNADSLMIRKKLFTLNCK